MDFNILKKLYLEDEIDNIQNGGEFSKIKNEQDLHDRLCNVWYNGKRIEFDDDLYDEMCRLLPFFDIDELNNIIIEQGRL